MQALRPVLTHELKGHIAGRDVWRADPYAISNYRELVEQVARLAYANRNHLLFFRGQDKDYQSKAGGSTLYPAIYRGDHLPPAEIDVRFHDLEMASRELARLFEEQGIEGTKDVSRKRYISWSILQHYEIIATPLLDVTQSLRVACSFAQLSSTDPTCYVYVLGFPYPTNRISINSEDELVNVRLLSICPPDALRPYFQEGYMAGTPDVATNFDTKTEVDFRNRLIAKFAIPRASRFWNAGFEATPKTALYPPGDRIEELCHELGGRLREEQRGSGDIGQLLADWARVEEQVLPFARRITERNVSVAEALRALEKRGFIDAEVAIALNRVRKVRNTAAHTPARLENREVDLALKELRQVRARLPEFP